MRKGNGEFTVPDAVLAVLADAKIKGKFLTLPMALDRKLYQEVNAVLESLGGKWDKKVRAHVFEDDPLTAVNRVLDTGHATDVKVLYQVFETPAHFAAEMVKRAQINEKCTVLEPSAGRGSLLRALYELPFAKVPDGDKITAVELQPSFCRELRAEFPCIRVHAMDFTEVAPTLTPVDRILANPPFTRQQDVVHVSLMLDLLNPGGILVAVMSAGLTFRTDRKTKKLMTRLQQPPFEHTIEACPAGLFRSEGTDVATVLLTVQRTV
jgi:protein-L-isoaspartate O-methyltransferase